MGEAMKYFLKKLGAMKYLGLWSPGLRNIFWKNGKPSGPLSYILNVRSLTCSSDTFTNFHVILCWSVKFVILSWFNSRCSKFNSTVASLKLDPQSGSSVLGVSLLLIKLYNTFTNDSVSSDSTSFKWTAHVTIQANRKPYLFNLECHCLINIGPKKSKPVLLNGDL